MKRNGFLKWMLVCGAPAFGLFCQAASDFDGSVGLESQASHSRLSLSLDSSFKPVVQETAKGFLMVIPSATLMDLGVPFGAEKSFNEYVSQLSDSRIGKLRVTEAEGRLEIRGDYRYPTGEAAFAKPGMEHFEFRKSEQGRYLVDFFYKKGPTRAEEAKNSRAQASAREKARLALLKKKEDEKRVSRERRIQDGRDALRFCERPFDPSTTVFLKFKPEHQDLKLGAYFPEKIPDHRFEYSDPRKTGEEADMVRLALKLSRENKHALAVRTVDFIEKEYPKSASLGEMRFLKANSYFRMGYAEQGKILLKEIAKTFRKTEVGLQAAGFLAAQNFENREWLAALEGFMNLKRDMPEHPLMWLFRYGIAESLYKIKQGDQAREEFEWLAKNAPDAEVRAVAAFKSGDVHLERGQFAQAVTLYQGALQKHEKYVNTYPLILMNLAEAYFQLDERDRAEIQFKRFMEIGANQPSAWRASVRLAELVAMKHRLTGEAEAAFSTTINRYPLSQGALVAQIRLLPCGNHGGFDLSGAERLIASPEVTQFSNEGAIYSSQFKELVGLTEVRMLISFKEYSKAIEKGILRLRDNPGVETRKLIEHAMIGAIKEILEKKLNEGDSFGAIAFFQKYGDYLPLPAHDPLADDLKMRIASIAAEKRLTQFALKIIEPYRMMNEASQKEVIAAIEKHLTLEGIDDQEERNLIEAKTLWNSPAFKIDDQAQVDGILTRLGFIRDQSRQGFTKNLILSLLHAEKKDFEKAFERVQVLTTLMAQVQGPARIQVQFFMGEVALQSEEPEFAAKQFRQAREGLARVSAGSREGELTFRHLSATPSQSVLYQNEGEALEKAGKWKEAVALYSEAIENKIGGNRVLFSHAKAILRTGGRDSKKVATASLEKIQQSQDDDVWKRLAKETLSELAKEGKNDRRTNP